MASQRIAYCPCGNLSVDGLNFERIDNGSLQCASCGACSFGFEYMPVSECEGKEAEREVAVPSSDPWETS